MDSSNNAGTSSSITVGKSIVVQSGLPDCAPLVVALSKRWEVGFLDSSNRAAASRSVVADESVVFVLLLGIAVVFAFAVRSCKRE